MCFGGGTSPGGGGAAVVEGADEPGLGHGERGRGRRHAPQALELVVQDLLACGARKVSRELWQDTTYSGISLLYDLAKCTHNIILTFSKILSMRHGKKV